jgi:hypothetical protein
MIMAKETDEEFVARMKSAKVTGLSLPADLARLKEIEKRERQNRILKPKHHKK